MKKLFGFLRKNEPERVHVYGISSAEFGSICIAIDDEYEAARSRQKPGAKGPSNYMKGLKFALDILENFAPHDLEVQK